jgi:hypothetical protein
MLDLLKACASSNDDQTLYIYTEMVNYRTALKPRSTRYLGAVKSSQSNYFSCNYLQLLTTQLSGYLRVVTQS